MSSLNTAAAAVAQPRGGGGGPRLSRAQVAQEFPHLAASLAGPDRSAAGAQAHGGRAGDERPRRLRLEVRRRLIPAVRIPPNIIPAMPNFYASAHVLDGYAAGVVVRHNMGRPIKVEGNPRHPASLGATDAFAQAELLDFYDPDRASADSREGQPSDRESLGRAARRSARHARRQRRVGLAHPDRHRDVADALAADRCAARALPASALDQWEPVSRDAVRRRRQLAYGRAVEIVPHSIAPMSSSRSTAIF